MLTLEGGWHISSAEVAILIMELEDTKEGALEIADRSRWELA